MADIVNLNRARKKKRAAEKEKIAQTNRAKFGRTKAEKSRDAFERGKKERAIDGAKRDDE
jgi:hypothetical protein